MISVFTPATCHKTTSVPYMPPATAAYYDELLSGLGIPSGTIESFSLQVCPAAASPAKPAPVAIFSTGLGTSRLIYSLELQWIASKGFLVMSVDHPYDADIVEYPDGTVIRGNVTDPNQLADKLALRVQDVSFVLNQFSNRLITNQLQLSAPFTSSTKAAIFGHSFGGATAGDTILADRRFIGGLNMDGAMFPPATNISSNKPFLIMAAQGHNQSTDESWAAFWQQLKGWKLQLEVSATKHLSYSDFPALAKVLGIDPNAVPEIGAYIGTIDGLRMLQIMRTYVGSFLNFVLNGQNDKLLGGPSKKFPEVSFRNSSKVK
jgi:predicted dienelactone hydrolase